MGMDTRDIDAAYQRVVTEFRSQLDSATAPALGAGTAGTR
jgi:hypothetical protein